MRTTDLNFSTNLKADDLRLAIVGSRFNEELTERLIVGARDAFLQCGGKEDNLAIVRVPGAYEIPLACKMVAENSAVDAIVTIGVIIEGETPHFDKLCDDVTDKLSAIMLTTEVPIGFGVVMARTLKQAEDRAQPNHSNKGREAAVAALEMAHLVTHLRGEAEQAIR